VGVPWAAYRRAVAHTLRAATACLLEGQSRDGFWREYHQLPPGPSEAWTTAVVGWCLAPLGGSPEVACARERAASAVWRARTPNGWGYNRTAVSDADSTAWAIRFLATTTRRASGPAVVGALAEFLDAAGHAHTFIESGGDGAWGAAHDDVTACVGLALISAHAPAAVIARPARALELRMRTGGPRTYWWRTDAYALIWAAMLLHRTGSLPRARGGGHPAVVSAHTGTTFETAHRLIGATLAGDRACVADLADELLERANWGTWTGSAELLVPAKDATCDSLAPGAHTDAQGLITTALASYALLRGLSSGLL
jgi:hypothetical protein